MEVLAFMVPLALMLGLGGLFAFLWSLKSGQYDDLDGAAWRAINDDDGPQPEKPAELPSAGADGKQGPQPTNQPCALAASR